MTVSSGWIWAVVYGLEGDADGTGEEAGLGPGDFGGDFDEGGLADGQVLGHAALHAVADGLRFGAESLETLGAEVAVSAGVGEESNDVVAGLEGCDVGADLGDEAGDFVAGDQGGADAASEYAVDDEEVVAAEGAGFDLDEDVGVAEGWVGEVCKGEVRVGAGLV